MALTHHFDPNLKINVRNLLCLLGRASTTGMITEDELTETEIKAIAALFVHWISDEVVGIGFIRQYAGNLYQCVQAHTTQSDWTPDVTPALWTCKSLPGVISDWVQPTGATDAYSTGDQVQYDSQVWESKIDANTTVPDGDVPYNRYWDIVE
jgi:hypothetical protein